MSKTIREGNSLTLRLKWAAIMYIKLMAFLAITTSTYAQSASIYLSRDGLIHSEYSLNGSVDPPGTVASERAYKPFDKLHLVLDKRVMKELVIEKTQARKLQNCKNEDNKARLELFRRAQRERFKKTPIIKELDRQRDDAIKRVLDDWQWKRLIQVELQVNAQLVGPVVLLDSEYDSLYLTEIQKSSIEEMQSEGEEKFLDKIEATRVAIQLAAIRDILDTKQLKMFEGLIGKWIHLYRPGAIAGFPVSQSPLNLIQLPTVQAEIGLRPSQKVEVEKLEEYARELRRSLAKTRNGRQELSNSVEAAIRKELKPPQVIRLLQLSRQAIVRNDGVISLKRFGLSLREDQEKRLAMQDRKMGRQFLSAGESIRRARFNAVVKKVLSGKQQAKLQTLLGEEFVAFSDSERRRKK